MPRILIVGSGQSGLILAHGLRREGWKVDLFTRSSTEELRLGPPALAQITFPTVRETEQALGLDLWSHQAPPLRSIELTMTPEEAAPVSFVGHLPHPAIAIDAPRIKTADLLEHFEDQGGSVIPHQASLEDLVYFAERGYYDVIVVAVGSSGELGRPGELGRHFAADPTRLGGASRRIVVQAYVYGALEGAADMCVVTTPHGEIFAPPVLTPQGPAVAVQILARPGGPLDITPYVKDIRRPAPLAQAITRFVNQTLERWTPELAARCARGDIAAEELMWKEITPVVRHPIARIGSTAAPLLGIGDCTLTVDPTSGQGAAASTLTAITIRDHLIAQQKAAQPFSAECLANAYKSYWNRHGRFCSAFGQMVTDFWSGTLPPTVLETFQRATTDPTVADTWVASFDQPQAFDGWLVQAS